MLIAVDPECSMHQLVQMMQVKLIWHGYLTEDNKTLFLNIGQMQLTTSLGKYILRQIKK